MSFSGVQLFVILKFERSNTRKGVKFDDEVDSPSYSWTRIKRRLFLMHSMAAVIETIERFLGDL
ncbi:hypothetical protein NBRC116583_01240 [Arenicella sp. 4NH20-0111]|uniref:hypothetical protein n=1 Tax=Arenicella sp. 4NH20-0111 TaxID=3127648 RepID=UPI00310BBD3A